MKITTADVSRPAGLIVSLFLLAAAIGCATQTYSTPPVGSQKVTVLCNSTVSHDTGFCQQQANDRCGGTARLSAIVSSVEMTGRETRQLYTITAQYDCVSS